MNQFQYARTPGSQTLSWWLVCLRSASDILRTDYRTERTVQDEKAYAQMGDMIKRLRAHAPVPPAPIADQEISTEQLFAGLTSYVAFTMPKSVSEAGASEWSVLRGLKPFKTNEDAKQMAHRLIQMLLGMAQTIEGQRVSPPAAQRLGASRTMSPEVKQRLHLLLWQGIISSLTPRYREAERRLVEAERLRPLVDAMITMTILSDRGRRTPAARLLN